MSKRPSSAAWELWSERVSAWRASGETADAFASGKGFRGSTMRYWSTRLRREVPPAASAPAARFVPVVPKSRAAAAGLVVEVSGARIAIARGFDAELLVEIVRALGGGAR